MRAILAAALLLAAPTAALADDAPALPPCQPLHDMTKVMRRDFHQFPAGKAIARDGRMLVIYRTRGGEEFTLVKVAPDGEVACIVDMGTELHIEPEGDGV